MPHKQPHYDCAVAAGTACTEVIELALLPWEVHLAKEEFTRICLGMLEAFEIELRRQSIQVVPFTQLRLP